MGAAEALARVLVAALVGGAIGLERELRGRAAGLRTHILVCAGSSPRWELWSGKACTSSPPEPACWCWLSCSC
ncbi:MAG TPA: hypothetical protein ENN53_05715 [Candidatus Acetothermia bacterium]|nr:hypothetical protein [Candidatus Acetothermia bacterium]